MPRWLCDLIRIKQSVNELQIFRFPVYSSCFSKIRLVAPDLQSSSICVQVFGLGSVAQVVTGEGAFGQYLSINLGFALGVAMGVHVGGKVSGMRVAQFKSNMNKVHCGDCTADRLCFSCVVPPLGAHMNAAVSFTMCTFGRLAWKMLPVYIFAQLLGSFLAAGTIYAVYYGEDTLDICAVIKYLLFHCLCCIVICS